MAKKTTFTVNNHRYDALEFDFNLICDLEDMGVSIDRIKRNPASAIRAYLALCMDAEKADAGIEIQEHMIHGGTLDDIITAMTSKLEESDFFQALNKESEEKTQKSTQKKSKEVKTTE